jgi:hypothetical protein
MVSPEQFAQVLEKGIILNLKTYSELGIDQKVLVNGMFPKTKTGVAIVEAKSSVEVNRQLQNFPAWLRVKWNVTPLKNF